MTLLAFALGGYTVPVGLVEPKPLSMGVDWLIFAFLGSTLVFTTLEKLFPKYREQVILRDQWGLDFFYFCLNHLLISAHTVLFDRLFGTYHFPKGLWPAEYGTTKKLPGSYLGQLFYPFRRD